MKILISLITITILLISPSIIICQDKEYSPTANEELFGFWVNKEYDGTKPWFPAHWKIEKNGELKYGYKVEPNPVVYPGTVTIKDKWTDANGYVWYKSIWSIPRGGTQYNLDKINNSGKIWEYVYEMKGFPAQFSKDHENYHIYHKEK